MLDLFKTRCVFIFKNSVSADWTKWKGNACKRTNESLMFKMFYLYGFFRWTKCIWWAIENNYLLIYKVFEFEVGWVSAVRISRNYLHFRKSLALLKLLLRNSKCILCIWGIVISTIVSFVFSAWLYFLLKSTTEENQWKLVLKINYVLVSHESKISHFFLFWVLIMLCSRE